MQRRLKSATRQEFQEIIDSTTTSNRIRPGDLGVQPRSKGRGGLGETQSGFPLLYLNSNNSIEHPEHPTPNTPEKLTPYHKKAAFALGENVTRFCSLYGMENCGFLTLTFPDNVQDAKEAARRFNSMNSNYLSTIYGEWIWARERQKRGAWHYHTIIDCRGDIMTGFDWDEYQAWITDYSAGKRRRLRTGNSLLRSLWEMNNRAFPSYGFGRVELLPIRSTAEAVGFYIGSYISKQIGQRPEEDKGVRLTGHSKGFTASAPKFSWNTEGGKAWRQNLALFAMLSCRCQDYDEFTRLAGQKWAYKYREAIIAYQDHMNVRYPEKSPF